MSQFSKDELSFVNKLPEKVEIECPICLDILVNPHLVSCCGHNFCEDCIERVKASNGPCPMCKERDFQAMVNKERLRIINGLQVYCNNKEKGCQWKGELKNLSTHLNKGEREGECQHEEVKCRHGKCEERKQRQNHDHHEAKECLQRPFKCQYCNTKGTYQSITEEHYKKCSKYPVLCPNKCTLTQMPRRRVTDHVNKECPLQPVDCVFSWAGCKERPLRKDTELHTTDTKHMMLLAVACGELKKENEQIKAVNTKMENQIFSIHHAIANNMHPILPIIIAVKSGVVHFYTDMCGRHMSAKLVRNNLGLTIFLALHKDKFNPNLPKIYAQRGHKTVPLIEDTEASYKEMPLDTLESITENGPVPPGVIKKSIGVSIFDSVSIFIN